MSAPRRAAIARALRWDLGALAAAACAFGLIALLRDPIVRPASDAELAGSRPPDRADGDVLVLLPDAPAAEALSFEELDCSYAWYNALWHHYGSFATALRRELSPELLAGRAAVLVPARVAQTMPATGVRALAEFAARGGALVIERPEQGWAPLAPAREGAPIEAARAITSVEGLGLRAEARDALLTAPLAGSVRRLPETEPAPRGPALLSIDGRPAWLEERVGQGIIHRVEFDLACSLLAMQQGRPSEGLTFGREEDAEELAPSSARVTQERLAEAEWPYADRLADLLFARLDEARPIPRLWPYPSARRGALIIAHPAPDAMRAALGYADWVAAQGATPVVFAAPDRLGPTDAARLGELGAELGLLWVRGRERPRALRSWGVGGITPLAIELDLSEQFQALEGRAGIGPDAWRLSMAEGTLLSREWASPFRRLAEAGVVLDMSLGPRPGGPAGYLFGTAYPFYPLDERGLPLPLLELPVSLHDAALTPRRLARALERSRAGDHNVIAISLPADAMRRRPRVGPMMALRRAAALAQEHDHWWTGARRFAAFAYARRRSIITSRWAPEARRLTVTANLIGAETGAEEPEAPGIALPASWRNRPLLRVTIDGEPVRLGALGRSGDDRERIAITGPGRHTIAAQYAED